MKVDKISIATMTDRNIIGVSKSPGNCLFVTSYYVYHYRLDEKCFRSKETWGNWFEFPPNKGIIIYSDSCTALDRMNMFYRIPFTRSNVLGTEILKGI